MRGSEAVNVPATGSCDGCCVNTINGMRVHEHGCQDAWRDEVRECLWCGSEFTPVERGQLYCDPGCARTFYL